MLCGTSGAVAAMDRAYMSLRARKPHAKTTTDDFRRWTTGSGGSSSYRRQDHRNHFSKQMSEGSAPQATCSGVGATRGQWPNGGVARWSLGLEQLLADPVGRAAFAEFLAREYALENIKFWCSCEEFNLQQDSSERAKLAKMIWERHLADDASEPVNVDAGARRAAMTRRNEDPVPQDLFHQAQRQIFHVMRMDSYQRFLRSGEHAECARADLRGLPPPPPYALAARSATPPPGPFSSHLFGSAPTTPSRTVQKSASNACERRKSGGPSLLPWRRAPSRGAHPDSVAHLPTALDLPDNVSRNAGVRSGGSEPNNKGHAGRRPEGPELGPSSAQDNSTPAAIHAANSGRDAGIPFSDLVKSGPLCRVVLPDGATSVVGVQSDIAVRHLVDRLLHRRNINAPHYDVLYRGAPEGGMAVIDGNAPSTVLGGREVVVERRCVVRMDIGGRVVAVRCRPARRLADVLRHILLRYSARADTRADARPATPAAPAPKVLRDGVLLSGDMHMECLDGARIQIIECAPDMGLEEEKFGSFGRDEVAEIPEVAVRSNTSSSLPSDDLRVVKLVSGYSEGGDRAPGGSGDAGGASADGAPVGVQPLRGPLLVPPGRVRAALRPGPPLHHSTYSFLDDLKDVQRKRVPGKDEPASTARAPPPVPPKPTIV